jgi:hypothetical protein
MTRDAGRAEVYAAEAAAFDGTDLEAVRSFEEIAALIAEVVGGAWWPGPSVRVVAARRDSTTSSARCDGGESTMIRLAAPQLTIATAAHELAHALAGPGAGHSPVFLAAYLDVVAVVTNLRPSDRRRELHVGQLRAALDAVGLVVGPRTWQPPSESTGAAIAL